MGTVESLNEPSPTSVNCQVINKILDDCSFVELSALSKGDNVVTGYGTINERLVYIFCQTGVVNWLHAKKVSTLYSYALKMGAPVVAVINSEGVYVENGLAALDGFGEIFQQMSNAKGKVPQVCYISGKCNGTTAFLAELSDFVFMAEKGGSLFLESPNVYEDAKKLGAEFVPDGAYHKKQTGLVDFCFNSEDDCVTGIRELLSYLPQNCGDGVPYCEGKNGDDLNRTDEALNSLFAEGSSYESGLYNLVVSVSDGGNFVESKMGYCPEMKTFISQMGGYTVGIIANVGKLTAEGLLKASNFINTMNSFNIPILTFSDANSYKNDSNSDSKLISNGAKLIYALAKANVPKINVVVKNAVGSPYLLFNSKHTGADIVFAWQSASVSVLNKEAGEKIFGIEVSASANEASSLAFVDDVIEPSATRKRVIVSLEMLCTKNVLKR